jgi:hypothetical protein
MIVIYENPVKSRAVTRWLCLCKRNSKSNAGEFGIPISGFTTVGTGPVT